MDHVFEATTIENDSEGFSDLKDQLLNSKNQNPESLDIRDQKNKQDNKEIQPSKKFLFKKGDQSLELDDDYELEFMADKRPTRLTLRELKDRAAGDIAIKNRMHSLAEEKKQIQATFKKFTEIAKDDPLAALEFISARAQESDSEFQYTKYLEMLAEQAEKLGQMDEKDRKSWELEKKLQKAEQDLSHKERTEAVVLRKQQMLVDYPEIGNQQFGEMVDAILSNDELFDGDEDEQDVMDKVEELIQETLTQRDIVSVIRDVNSEYVHNNDFIFSLSDQLRQNPDLDEEDVRNIVSDLIGSSRPRVSSDQSQRQKDIRTLSRKAREATPDRSLRTQNVSPFDLLKDQLLERKKEMDKTPLYKR